MQSINSSSWKHKGSPNTSFVGWLHGCQARSSLLLIVKSWPKAGKLRCCSFRQALDLFVSRQCETVLGSAQSGVISRFGKHTESPVSLVQVRGKVNGTSWLYPQHPWYKQQWSEIMFPRLVRKCLGAFRGENILAYHKCSGVVRGNGQVAWWRLFHQKA